MSCSASGGDARIEVHRPGAAGADGARMAEALQKLNNRPAYRSTSIDSGHLGAGRGTRRVTCRLSSSGRGRELAPGDILIHSELMLPPAPTISGQVNVAAHHHRSRGAANDEAARKRCVRRAAASAIPRGCGTTTTGISHLRHRARFDPSLAAAVSRIEPTSGSMRRWMCPVSTREFAGIRRTQLFHRRSQLARNDSERPSAAEGLR